MNRGSFQTHPVNTYFKYEKVFVSLYVLRYGFCVYSGKGAGDSQPLSVNNEMDAEFSKRL